MPLIPGTKLGSYEVVSVIGAGGMGEVYRAHDHRLGRDVALKALPDAFSRDPDRLARFEREAKALASLNHPNIAAIYGVEDVAATATSPAIHALVMELVPGRTLADLIESVADAHGQTARRPVPVTDAVGYARQIALALEAAHDAGIIHRDLKPANVKVTGDDVIKVLDFGLARTAVDSAFETADARAATVTSPAMTQAGVILGTAAYMAPEQARGKPTDKRADIWAFGVVLFEMLTSRRLFDGETVTDVVAQVLTRPIDLSALPAETPARVRELMARCLERDPKRRLRDIGEARIALSDPVAVETSATSGVSASTAVVAQSPKQRSIVLPWIIAIASLIVATLLTIGFAVSSRMSRTLNSSAALLLEIGAPPDGDFIVGANAGSIIIAPDSSAVAFLVQTTAGRKLYVRSLLTGDTHAVPGVVDPVYPFWSADSRKIAYFGNEKLFTMNLAGGLPEAIADTVQGRGGAWTDTGEILFTPNGGGTIHRVSEHGGAVTEITKLDDTRGENAHYWPVALPGGRKFLYFVRSRVPQNNGIYLGTVDGSVKPTRLLTSLSSGLFAAAHNGMPGRLLWVRDGNLLAQPLDVETGALSGEVSTLATDVRVEESQRGTFAGVANNGTLVWASAQAADFQFATVDRTGRRLATLPVPSGKIIQPVISPDDRKLLFTRASGGTADIWTYDFVSKEVRQVSTDSDYDEDGIWSPDSRAIFYHGLRGGKSATLIATLDGSKPEQIITLGTETTSGAFSRDGRSVFLPRDHEQDIALVRLSDPTKTISLTREAGTEWQPVQSPDDHWLAFSRYRSGHQEVVLAPYEDDGRTPTLGDQRIPVSVGDGGDPHWSRDGKEILYRAPNGVLQAVGVNMVGKSIALGRPTPLSIQPAEVAGGTSNWATNSTHTLFVIIEAPLASRQTFRVLLGK